MMYRQSPSLPRWLLTTALLLTVVLLAQATGGCSFSASPAASPSPSGSPPPAAGAAAPGLFDDRLDPDDLSDGDTAAAVREDTKELHAATLRTVSRRSAPAAWIWSTTWSSLASRAWS